MEPSLLRVWLITSHANDRFREIDHPISPTASASNMSYGVGREFCQNHAYMYEVAALKEISKRC
jgi:hypothetical protein